MSLEPLSIPEGFEKELFPMKILQNWARTVSRCDGNHENLHLVENVRKITQNEEFIRLRNSQSHYLIPDASEASVPGIRGAVPRGFIQDVIFYAEFMVYSQRINHGLSADDLEILYQHHCIEPMISYGGAFKLTPQESLTILNHYINRVGDAAKQSNSVPPKISD